jgi:hypothetical protein
VDLLAAGFSASTSATIAGVKYSADQKLLKAGAKSTGRLVPSSPMRVSDFGNSILTTAAGVVHPRDCPLLAIRYYTATKMRVSMSPRKQPGPTTEPPKLKTRAEVMSAETVRNH